MSMSYMLSEYFHDPNGSDLSYTASSSDPAVATASAANGTLTVTAVSAGMATITVTAMDAEGLTAPLMFMVTVPSAPAVMPGAPSEIELPNGTSRVLTFAEEFSDAAGATFSAVSDNTASVRVAMSADGAMVTLYADKKGMATITLTATVAGMDPMTKEITVTVPNQGPVYDETYKQSAAEATLLDANLAPVAEDDRVTDRSVADTLGYWFVLKADPVIDLSFYFEDPDNDSLTYSGTSTSQDVIVRGFKQNAAADAVADEYHDVIYIDVVHFVDRKRGHARLVDLMISATDTGGEMTGKALTVRLDIEDKQVKRAYPVKQETYGLIHDVTVDYRRLDDTSFHTLVFDGGFKFPSRATGYEVDDEQNGDEARPATPSLMGNDSSYYTITSSEDSPVVLETDALAWDSTDSEHEINFTVTGSGMATITVTYHHYHDSGSGPEWLTEQEDFMVTVETVS
jgi:hypothetical protein